MKLWVGIDVGKAGCLCTLSEQNEINFYDFPNEESEYSNYFVSLQELYIANDIQKTYIERVNAMPKQGSVSMFTFGTNYGLWQAFLILTRKSYDFVRPQKWMKSYNISKQDGATTKTQVKTVVKRLFPMAEISSVRGAYKDGRGDALLLANFAKNEFKS